MKQNFQKIFFLDLLTCTTFYRGGKITRGPNKAIGDFPRFLSEWLKIRTDDRLLKMQVAAGVKVEGGWLAIQRPNPDIDPAAEMLWKAAQKKKKREIR